MAGRYKAYPAYKDSGVEWLGEIPEGWRISKLRFISTFGRGLNITKANLKESGIPCVSYGEVHSKYGFEVNPSVNDLHCVDEEYLKTDSKSLLEKGDLIFADTSEDIEGSGNFTQLVSDDVLFAGYHCVVVRPTKEIFYRYLAYLCDSVEYRMQIRNSVKGVKVFSITQQILKDSNVWIPGHKEQQTIAKFLDYETAKIDALIAKQEQLIELLKEKRQAVISHAVTKGLNPDAPMKDSGVEWLGQVPEHWQVCKLKHIASLQTGIAKGRDLTGLSKISVPMLRVANVQDGYLDLSDIQTLEIEPHQLMRYSLRNGDVLMNEGGDNDKLGRGAIWESQIHPCIHQNHVFAIRPYRVEPNWLDLITRSEYAKFYFFSVAKQSTNLASISSSNIKETPIVVPPQSERVEIVKYLNTRAELLGKLESKCVSFIQLLQERKTALISAAVTGKIDVRDWQPPSVG